MEKSSRIALITGATGGIGLSLCSGFKHEGYRVIATDVSHNCSVDCDQFVEADLKEICSDEAYLKEFIEQLQLDASGLTVLVNNAATQILNKTQAISMQDWRDTLDVNLLAPFALTQALLTDLEKGNGSVINISSVHSSATKPGFVCYSTSKAALDGLTRALAVDLGNRVRVNSINPAAVITPMLLDGFKGRDDQYAELAKMHPLGRIAEPSEISQVAVFLASSKASFLSGTALNVDGGILSRLHDPE